MGKNIAKPVILTFTGHYLPGYKGYGILRNTVNTVDALHSDMEFRIVTRDRDLGDEKPYDDILVHQWQRMGNAMVYYLSPESCNIRGISRLISETHHDALYFTSCFDLLTVLPLIARRMGKIPARHTIVEPNGEFGWASLKQKFLKKVFFIQLARIFKIYENVTWHATSEHEKQDISRFFKIQCRSIFIAPNLPGNDVDYIPPAPDHQKYDQEELKLIFLSRIAPEKNLDYALKILSRVKTKTTFDIYGPIGNATYWEKCLQLIELLPENVKANYCGEVEHREVKNTFALYDMFLFPTRGEGYGIVIAESLTAGTPVLISDKTLWKGLREDGLGWDIALEQMDSFVSVIDQYAALSLDERRKKRKFIQDTAVRRIFDPAVLEANRQLFLGEV